MVNNPNKTQLDATLKQVLSAVRTALDNVAEVRAFLYTLGANDAAVLLALQAPEFGYALADATNVLNAVNALNQLRTVANAGATVGAVDDFFFYAKKVWGIPLR